MFLLPLETVSSIFFLLHVKDQRKMKSLDIFDIDVVFVLNSACIEKWLDGICKDMLPENQNLKILLVPG